MQTNGVSLQKNSSEVIITNYDTIKKEGKRDNRGESANGSDKR